MVIKLSYIKFGMMYLDLKSGLFTKIFLIWGTKCLRKYQIIYTSCTFNLDDMYAFDINLFL
jgi:hypothetical protein